MEIFPRAPIMWRSWALSLQGHLGELALVPPCPEASQPGQGAGDRGVSGPWKMEKQIQGRQGGAGTRPRPRHGRRLVPECVGGEEGELRGSHRASTSLRCCPLAPLMGVFDAPLRGARLVQHPGSGCQIDGPGHRHEHRQGPGPPSPSRAGLRLTQPWQCPAGCWPGH